MTFPAQLVLLITLIIILGCTRGEGTSVNELVETVATGTNVKVRQDTCYALADRENLELADKFLKWLSDPVLSACAATGLGKLKEKRAVPMLMALLKDRANFNRVAVWALGEIGDKSVLDALKQLREKPNGLSEDDIAMIREVISKLEQAQRAQGELAKCNPPPERRRTGK